MSRKGKLFTAFAVAALAVPALAAAQGYGAYGNTPPPAYGQGNGYGPSYGQGYEDPQGYGPGPRSEQSYDGQGAYGRQPDAGPHQGRHAQLGAYPQFHALEKHIKRTVRQARRDNSLDRRDARDMLAQLRQIQDDEASAYQSNGPNLPPRLAARIQGELTQLAQAADQGHGGGYQQGPYQDRQ